MRSRSSMFIDNRRRSGRSVRRVVLQVALVVVVAIVLLVALLWWYTGRQFDTAVLPALAERPAAGAPVNTLVALTDGPQPGMADDRSDIGTLDTVLLVQHAAARSGPAVVSFPADLRVTWPGQGPARLAEVLEQGGPDALVATLADFTGLDVHHYVGVDLAGVPAIVDAVGGVELCLDEPFEDREMQLRLVTGCQAVDGVAADAFIRSDVTHPQFGRDEFGQAARRAAVLQATSEGFTRAGALSNPLVWWRVLGTAGSHAVTDHAVGLWGFVRAAGSLSGVRPDDLIVRTVPATVQTLDGDLYIVAAPEQAPALFDLLRRGAELDTEIGTEPAGDLGPRNVTVLVVNGVGISGLAGEVREFLEVREFVVLDAVNPSDLDPDAEWDPTLVRMSIRHAATTLPHAELLRDHLGDVPVDLESVDADDLPDGADVVLVVGSGWTG